MEIYVGKMRLSRDENKKSLKFRRRIFHAGEKKDAEKTIFLVPALAI